MIEFVRDKTIVTLDGSLLLIARIMMALKRDARFKAGNGKRMA